MIDRILAVMAIVSLCILSFLLGAADIYYNGPGSLMLREAFMGGKGWKQEQQEKTQTQNVVLDYDLSHKQLKAWLGKTAKVEWDKDRAYNGYTLMTYGETNSAFLVDMSGKIVHAWNIAGRRAWPHPRHAAKTNGTTTIENARLFPNGDLLVNYNGINSTPYGFGLVKWDKDGKLLWKYEGLVNHDFSITDNGDIYAVAHELKKNANKNGAAYPVPRMYEYLVRLSPDGKELKRYYLEEMFRNSAYKDLLDKIDHKPRWDFIHTNSVVKLEDGMASAFPMFKPGYLLISIRHLSALAVIDPEQGKVVKVYTGGWKEQHSAKFLPNGHILFFDNRGYRVKNKEYSRLLEIDPATSKIVWSYTGEPDHLFDTRIRGRSQPLPNGNVLVTESENMRAFEVTHDGKIVWDYKTRKARTKTGETSNVKLFYMHNAWRYAQADLPFLKEPDAKADEQPNVYFYSNDKSNAKAAPAVEGDSAEGDDEHRSDDENDDMGKGE